MSHAVGIGLPALQAELAALQADSGALQQRVDTGSEVIRTLLTSAAAEIGAPGAAPSDTDVAATIADLAVRARARCTPHGPWVPQDALPTASHRPRGRRVARGPAPERLRRLRLIAPTRASCDAGAPTGRHSGVVRARPRAVGRCRLVAAAAAASYAAGCAASYAAGCAASNAGRAAVCAAVRVPPPC